MTYEQACEILFDYIGDWNYETCVEYNEFFVFIKDERAFDGALAVNKDTGVVMKYIPFLIPLDELRSGGKRITTV